MPGEKMVEEKVPVLRDAIEPSELVFAYKDLDVRSYVGRLAPSLGLLIIHKLYEPTAAISKEFVDCELFLGMTELSPFIEALKIVNKTLQASSGAVTISLTHEMGFGKTHFETLLFHLYTEVPKRWKNITSKPVLEDAVQKLTEESLYKLDVANKTFVLPLDLKTIPQLIDPYDALFENCARIIEEYKEAEKEVVEFIRKLKNVKPERAAIDLARFIKKTGITTPFLILLDEVYARVFETVEGGDRRQIQSLINLMIFLTSFIDAIKEHSPVVLVYASAQQDINRWEDLAKLKEYFAKQDPIVANLILTVEHFKERTSRKEVVSVRHMTKDEAVDVVLKRLIQYKADRGKISKRVASVCRNVVKEYTTEHVAEMYYNLLLKTYPFVPTYRYFAEKLLTPTVGGDLPKTQHVRDLLRVTSSLIAKVYESEDWNNASLIGLSHLTHDDVNHLLEEKYSMEWGRLYARCRDSLTEIKDADCRGLAEKMLPIVYVKSLTTNISKLLDMIRTPEMLPREEIVARGTSIDDIIFSLVGTVSTELLKSKLHEAYNRLAKSPSIIDVEHERKKYLLMSFVFNPMELIESFKNEEMARFRTPEGTVKYQEMVEYFRNQLEADYNITGKFAEKSEEAGRPKLVLINYDTMISVDERGRPRFVNYLDRDRFTILVLTPWSVARRLIESKEPIDLVEKIREIIQKFKGDIQYPNMFAIVVPSIEKGLLQRLCNRIAEVNAAKKVVSHLRVEKVEEYRKKRLELARRAPTYQTLIPLLKEREERFEDIILEVMDALQKKIEDYAKNITNTAVQDYITELVGSFKNIIYFDVNKNVFVKDAMRVRYELRDNKFEKIYGELPAWIADATISKCGVDKRDSIISKLISYIMDPYVEKHKEDLVKGKRILIKVRPLVEAAMRGWKDLPIRPLSRKEMESALTGIMGPRLIAGMNVKVFLLTRNGERFMAIELMEKPPPPPPPPPQVNAIKIWEIGNVIIGMELLRKDKLGDNVKYIDISIETIDECSFRITKASLEDLEWIIGEDPINAFISRLSSISPLVKFARLHIKLSTPMEKQKVEKTIISLGVSEDNFSTE